MQEIINEITFENGGCNNHVQLIKKCSLWCYSCCVITIRYENVFYECLIVISMSSALIIMNFEGESELKRFLREMKSSGKSHYT